MVSWNNDFNIKLFLKRLHYTLVKGNPTLKYYWGFNILSQTNIVKVIANQRLAQTIDNILNPMPHLLFMYHI